MNEPAVAVLTNTRDLAADDVIRRLAETGTPVIRLNADRPDTMLTWSTIGDIRGIGAVWWRQFEKWSTRGLSLPKIDELMVNRAQWRAWISVLDDGRIPWINHPWPARRAENKLEQLRLANAVGFSVPETIVTNSAEEARRFASNGNAIVKSLAAAYFEFSGDGFVYTHRLEDALAQPDSAWTAQPLIVQRAVSGDDVRVIAFGGKFFGAKCSSPQLDWRTSRPSAPWTEWEIPSELLRFCSAYLSSMDLRYAAFDFMLDSSDIWFLEANQAGEWVFLDRPLSLGIADSLASYLRLLARQEVLA